MLRNPLKKHIDRPLLDLQKWSDFQEYVVLIAIPSVEIKKRMQEKYFQYHNTQYVEKYVSTF